MKDCNSKRARNLQLGSSDSSSIGSLVHEMTRPKRNESCTQQYMSHVMIIIISLYILIAVWSFPTGGLDYVPINEELTIGVGANYTHTVIGARVCVAVQAIPDNLQESDESFRIRVTSADGGTKISDRFLTILLQDREPDDDGEG